MLEEVRSDILVAQARHATVGALRTDNTHPFRYRQWMFANTGTIDGFSELRPRLMETLPKFLQRSVRGDTDSEVLFHLFSIVSTRRGPAGAQPRQPRRGVSRAQVQHGVARPHGRRRQAIAYELVARLPDYLIAVQRGAPMGYRILSGREALEPMYADHADGSYAWPTWSLVASP